jgi:hypothetical protein
MAKEEREEDGIYKVETVPPPDGGEGGDAYNAPTRVGPVTTEAWAELLRQANEEGAAKATEGGPPRSGIPSSGPQSKPRPVSTPIDDNAPLPRLNAEADGEDDEGDAATKLGPDAHLLMGRAEAAGQAASAPANTAAKNIATPPIATAAPRGLTPPRPAAPPLPRAATAPAAPAPPAPAFGVAPPPAAAAPAPPAPVVAPAPLPATAPASTSGGAHPSLPPLRPLAFPPNVEPHPSATPVARSDFSRGIRLLIAICLTVFAVGLAVFLLRKP